MLGHSVGMGVANATSKIGEGIKALRLMIGGPNNEPGALPIKKNIPLIHGGNAEEAAAILAGAATSKRPVLMDALFTEAGYKEFLEGAKLKAIRVVDTDSLEEKNAIRKARPFGDVTEAIGAIAKVTDRNPMTVEQAQKIIERTASSDIAIDHKRAIYETISAELIEERANIETARELRSKNSEKSDTAIQELDNSSLERLRENVKIEEALRELQYVKNEDVFLRNIQRNVAVEGIENTIHKISDNPTQFVEQSDSRGTTIGAGPEADELRETGAVMKADVEFMAVLKEYVENIGVVKSNADSVLDLRNRQALLDETLRERENAMETVEKQIKRETALLDPQAQREILRDSLNAILTSRQTQEPELVKVGLVTAHAEEREEEVRVGHDISNKLHDVSDGRDPADAIGRTSSQAVIQGFDQMTTRAVARLYESYPEKDPTRSHQVRAESIAEEATPRKNPGKILIDEEARKMGGVLGMEGFAAETEDSAKPGGGRNIRTRSRQARTSNQQAVEI